jgi:hypothetical protein
MAIPFRTNQDIQGRIFFLAQYVIFLVHSVILPSRRDQAGDFFEEEAAAAAG